MKNLLKKVRAFIMALFGFDENKNKQECVPMEQINSLIEEKIKQKFGSVSIKGIANNSSKTVSLPTGFKGRYTKAISYRLNFNLADGGLYTVDNANLVVSGKTRTYPSINIHDANNTITAAMAWENAFLGNSGTATSVDIEVQLMRTDV